MFLPSNSEDLIKFLKRLYDTSDEHLSVARSKWQSYYKSYRSYINEEEYPLRNYIFLPWTFSIIETITPRFVSGMLYRRPMIQVRRAHPVTTYEAVRLVSLALNSKWMIDKKTWHSLLMMIKESLLCGTSVCKSYWSQLERKVPTYRPVHVDSDVPMLLSREKSILIENRPRIEHCDIYDITMDLLHGQEPEWVCHHVVKSLSDIKWGPIKYKNIAAVEELNDSRKQDEDWLVSRISAVDGSIPGMEFTEDRPRDLYEFTLQNHTKEGVETRIVTIANWKVVIRDEIIDYWPYHFVRNYEDPHMALGISEIESIHRVNHGHNFHFNLMMESMLMSLMKMWLVGQGANADFNQFALEPFGIIQVDDVSQVKELNFSPISGDAFNMDQMFTQAYQAATGLNDYVRGFNPSRREAATSIMALQSASEARIDARIKQNERTWLCPIAEQFISLAQSRLEEPEYVRGSDQDFTSVMLHQIQGPMEFEISSGSSGMNEVKRQQLLELTQHMSNMLGPEAPPDARMRMFKAIAHTFNDEDIEEAIDDIEKALSQAPPPIQQGPPGAGIPGQPGAIGPTAAGPNIAGPNGAPGIQALAGALSAAQGGPTPSAN